ncbi:hypothetical protein J3R82DRAFT_8783 [Butyriboletus roseoflavus]|nr:hypothetical protein J3R82DRAFT_8783 [Butyriboletus roseoflavus]
MATPRVWLSRRSAEDLGEINANTSPLSVTGASSGFGKSMTEFVLSKGDIAVATLRKPEVLHELSASYSKDKLLILKVDVTNQADIDCAFARTKEVFGRLDVVFNNAGYSIFGEAEMTPIDLARAMFEVNFWGAVNVSRAAIKFFREVNEPGRGGVLLQNSSIAGVNSFAGVTFYSATKHAFDGFSEGLAKEILPQWNIKVGDCRLLPVADCSDVDQICIIQAGGFSTNVFANSIILPEDPIYDDKTSELAASRSFIANPEPKIQADPAKFVKAIYLLVEGGNMPLHLPIGQDALAVLKVRVESLGKEISEAAPWSADLLWDDIGLSA